VPLPLPSPQSRRFARPLLAGVLGIGIGLAAAAAVQHRAEGPAASVRRLDLPVSSAAGPPPATFTPAAQPPASGSAREAVQRFLAARVRGDLAAAFDQLDRAGMARYGGSARWTEAAAQRPRVTGFRLGEQRPAGPDTADVTVEVRQQATIDPFAGLVAGRSLEVWRAHREAGRWRVEAEPRSARPLLPGDRDAPEAVAAWLRALTACDLSAAARLQVEPTLYGPGELAAAPCSRRGRWTVGAARPFGQDADSQPYVAAFGPDVIAWARLIPVTGPRTGFYAVVGPLGDAWRVIGTSPMEAAG
jgi:hypothetical protein